MPCSIRSRRSMAGRADAWCRKRVRRLVPVERADRGCGRGCSSLRFWWFWSREAGRVRTPAAFMDSEQIASRQLYTSIESPAPRRPVMPTRPSALTPISTARHPPSPTCWPDHTAPATDGSAFDHRPSLSLCLSPRSLAARLHPARRLPTSTRPTRPKPSAASCVPDTRALRVEGEDKIPTARPPALAKPATSHLPRKHHHLTHPDGPPLDLLHQPSIQASLATAARLRSR